jgi:hypothetical protein
MEGFGFLYIIDPMSKLFNKLYSYTSPILWRVPFRMRYAAATRVAVSVEHKFAYIRMPKAANSTITRTLAINAFRDKQQSILADDSGGFAKSLFGGAWDSGCLTENSFLGNYYTFSFFRDPYTRVLSAYLDKIKSSNLKGFAEKIEQRYGEASFEKFITYLEDGGLLVNAHWAPQTNVCPFPVDKLNFVGKIEKLDEGMNHVLHAIFKKNLVPELLQTTEGRTFSGGKRESYYNPSLRKRVYQLYKRDFEQLRYDA